MRKKILLNCLPPVIENTPSPALSVLKSYLEENGYEVEIKYWNLYLHSYIRSFFNFGEKILEDSILKLLPFFSYIALKKGDTDAINRIIDEIIRKKPYLTQKGRDYIYATIVEYANGIIEYIDNELTNMKLENYSYFGFSSLFYQWIPANIIKERIDCIAPNSKFIIGGFGTFKEAKAFLKNFSGWNYALWGEGEVPLLQFSEFIKNEMDLELRSKIPNFCYLDCGNIYKNNIKNVYANLNESFFDFSDYIIQIKELKDYGINNETIILPLERSRGCHWGRCRFCYLNSSYKYRIKSDSQIIEEIKLYIDKYGISNFTYLDNDLIGEDNNAFNRLLDKIIELRKEKDFNFYLSEIETKNINKTIIRKLKLAGFVNVQFGYESPSDKLLEKINKKNTFASNLLFAKWSDILGIKVIEPHIIRNLLEENDNDIKEGIWNLYYQRFILDENSFRHHYTNLAISSSSPYYKQVISNGEIERYQSSKMMFLLPDDYIDDNDKFHLFLDIVSDDFNKLWRIFETVEEYYIQNKYTYQLIKQDSESVIFIEFVNGDKRREIILDKILFSILSHCNNQVSSINSLQSEVLICNEEKDKLLIALNNLKKEGLLYSNEDMSEIVSVVNTENIL